MCRWAAGESRRVAQVGRRGACRPGRFGRAWLQLAVLLLPVPVGLRAADAGTLQPPPQQRITGAAAALSTDLGLEGSNSSSRMSFLLSQLTSELGSGGLVVSLGNASSHAVWVRFQKDGDALPSQGLPSGAEAFSAEGDEGYRIVVMPFGTGLRIVVASASDHGLWNGAMTLRQMLLTDGGAAEASLAPQIVRDYADHPVRAAMPYDLDFTQRDGQNRYVVSSAQLAVLDRLAHLKINTVIFSMGTIATDSWQWLYGQSGLAALQRAAAERFIDLVPSLGSLQSAWAPTYRDGWWIHDEPMKLDATTGQALPDNDAVAGRRSGNLVINGGFESASGGTPTGWTLSGTGLAGASFTRDASVRASGAYSMRLDATTGSPEVTLGHGLAGPLAAGHYLVSARFKTQIIEGSVPRLTARAIVGGQALSPARYLTAQLYTSGWDRHQGILRVPYGLVAERIELSVAWESGSGTLWVDDVEVTRIDADLRNVLRGAYDVRVTSTDGLTTYRAGLDYTVEDGEFADVYAQELVPSRLERVPGGSLPLGARVLVSYDKNLYPGLRTDVATAYTSRAGDQGLDLCSGRPLTDLYGPALVRLLWELPVLNPDLPLKALFLASDEIRGFNRGGACHNADGSLSASNAQRLASFLDAVAAYARAIRPGVALYLWGDMLSAAHNGGIPSYQVDQGDPANYGRNLGGSPGMTFCALAPAGYGCAGQGPTAAIDTSLRPISWWPNSAYLFQKQFEGAFFDDLQRPFLVAALSDPLASDWQQGIRDTAALAAAMPSSLGFLDAYEIRAGALELKASLAWNDEWRQRVYEPFEFDFDSLWGLGTGRPVATDYAITNGSIRTDESCAAPQRFRPEADKTLPAVNRGGVCLDSPGGALRFPAMSVDNSLAYHVSFQSRASSSLPGTLRLHWHSVQGEESIEDLPIQIGSSTGDWARSQIDLPSRRDAGGSAMGEVTPEIIAPAAAKIDDFMLWEERPGCPFGEIVASAPPVTLRSAGTGTAFDVSLPVSNPGCRDLRILSVGSFPDTGLSLLPGNSVPIVIPADRTATLLLGGTTPAYLSLPAQAYIYLQTNHPTSPYVWVAVSITPPSSCGLLGPEAFAAFAVARLLVRGRRRAGVPVGLWNAPRSCTADRSSR